MEPRQIPQRDERIGRRGPQHDAAKLSAAVNQAASTGGLGIDPAALPDAA
jgi:hypothetical protein